MARARQPTDLVNTGLDLFNCFCGALSGLLGLRMLFRLLIANPDNPVTTAVFAISRPLLFPWDRWWPPTQLPISTVERATAVSLITYLLFSLMAGLLRQALYPQGAHNDMGPASSSKQ